MLREGEKFGRLRCGSFSRDGFFGKHSIHGIRAKFALLDHEGKSQQENGHTFWLIEERQMKICLLYQSKYNLLITSLRVIYHYGILRIRTVVQKK